MSANREENEDEGPLPEYELAYGKAKTNRFDIKMSPVERFSELLAQWAHGFVSQSSTTNLAVSLPDNFHPDEANGFLRALDADILRVSDTGRCFLPSIHRTKKPTEPCLFSIKNQSVVYLAWPEYITQVGALASLAIDYGWPQELLALDPRKDTTFDIACYSSSSATALMLVAGETKKTEKELLKLRQVILKASDSRLTLEYFSSYTDTEGSKRDINDRKKYIGLLREQPVYFWMVAPGTKWVFLVNYDAGAAIVEELSDLPNFKAITGR